MADISLPSSPPSKKKKGKAKSGTFDASQSTEATRSQWSDKDVRNLLDFLMQHKAEAGDGGNFKPSVWQAAAETLAKYPPERGASKTAASCKSKWSKVSSR
jgi:hypothetical protein